MPFDARTRTKPTRRELDAKRGKLAKDRAQHITGHLCALTRDALASGRILTPLAYEALFRRVIRSELCLQGWRWQAADDAARAVVSVVLFALQAKRPSWNEGQREHTIEGGALIERILCARCHKRLPDDRPKFCSDLCKSSYNSQLLRLREANENQMAKMASRAP